MNDYDPNRLQPLLQLLNSASRREALSIARTVMVTGQDLAFLARFARAGGFERYRYAVHFADRVPSHLLPRTGEYTPELRLGPLSGEGAKLVRKLFQIFEERKLFAAHLLYTPDHQFWDLLYFDQRDVQREKPHWVGGPHMHFASASFHRTPLGAVWARVRRGDTGFLRGIHVPFDFWG